MADISVAETIAKGATPISMIGIGDERSFKGTFDGNGHTLTLKSTRCQIAAPSPASTMAMT